MLTFSHKQAKHRGHIHLDEKHTSQMRQGKTAAICEAFGQFAGSAYAYGSEGDEMSRVDFQEEYRAIARETGAEIHIFSQGAHPAILSNAEQAAEVIGRFLEQR